MRRIHLKCRYNHNLFLVVRRDVVVTVCSDLYGPYSLRNVWMLYTSKPIKSATKEMCYCVRILGELMGRVSLYMGVADRCDGPADAERFLRIKSRIRDLREERKKRSTP